MDDQAQGKDAMTHWQPIATAPKDQHVLVCDPNGNVYVAVFTQARAGFWGWTQDKWTFAVDPTHWMLRPDPPVQETPEA